MDVIPASLAIPAKTDFGFDIKFWGLSNSTINPLSKTITLQKKNNKCQALRVDSWNISGTLFWRYISHAESGHSMCLAYQVPHSICVINQISQVTRNILLEPLGTCFNGFGLQVLWITIDNRTNLSESRIVLRRWAMVRTVQSLNSLRIVLCKTKNSNHFW